MEERFFFNFLGDSDTEPVLPIYKHTRGLAFRDSRGNPGGGA